MMAAESAPPPTPTVSSALDPSVIQWRAHPWQEESPARSTTLLGIILAVGSAAAWSFEHVLYGLGSILLLLATTSRYLLPTDHRLDAQGASTTHMWLTRQLRWPQIARIDVHKDGLFLSPFRHPSRLDGFRGMFLRYSNNGPSVAVAVDHWRRQKESTE